MTFVDRLETIVRTIDYKPGWRLEIKPGPVGSILLRASHLAPDSDDPTNPELRMITRDRPVPDLIFDLWRTGGYTFEGYVQHWIRDEIIKMERHETDEWFRVRGVRLVEPHRVPNGA